jgi:hypothetical protein
MYLTALATKNPLGAQTQPRMSAHDVWCIHTMVGSLAGTRHMFEANGFGGTESHFGTGGAGEAEQWQDTRFTADANYQGNPRVLSCENADLGPGFERWNTNDGGAVPAFTDAQVQTNIALGVAACLPGRFPGSMHADCPHDWACYSSGIPAKLIPDTKPGRRGVAYHAQGVPGNGLVAGGEAWSLARGKVCPGARRIAQVKQVIVPAIAERVAAVVAGDARVPKPATPASPQPSPNSSGVKPPAFPLPADHYYGPESSDSHCHSGYYAKDQAGIRTWQAQMRSRGWTLDVDGHFGGQSQKVAAAFQAEKRLDADGLVGAKTWAATWTAKVTG